ncbi:MAG TPA: HAD family phosphatase [Sphaerochaeta sp.]|nr:HAD family phosphatase [Sphaerochaeta sp.]
MKYPNIRSVAFDYGGVLAYFIDEQEIREMATVAQVSYEEFNTGMWAFRKELDSGEYDNTHYWTLVLDSCNSGAPRQTCIATLVEMDLKGFSRMNQSMLQWAKTLKAQGFGTLIISNMAEPTYQRLIASQEWMQHFDAAIISGVIGINKPDRRIFKHALESVHLDASEVLFLDDLIHNVQGAQASGLHALLFSDTRTLAEDLAAYYPNLPVDGLDSPLS